MHKVLYILSILGILPILVCSQNIKVLKEGAKVNLRGLSVVDDDVVWVSGSNGTVGNSLDGGRTWNWKTVPGFEKADFRDIEAFDGYNAVIMAIASPAYILRTSDGGSNWRIVFTLADTSMFLDAMEFWDDRSGIVIGDPLSSKIFLATTIDAGKSWKIVPPAMSPVAQKGEAFFAASGTNIRRLNEKEVLFVSGGTASNLYYRQSKIPLPILKGKETTGANSIAVKNSKTFMVVGGDFLYKDSTTGNCVYTKNEGKTFKKPTQPPHGYRSCVEYLEKNTWITCGLNGVDITEDDGDNFSLISDDAYNVVGKAKKGSLVILAGPNGKIARFFN